MKKLWLPKIKINFSEGAFEKVFNPFAFWKMIISLFFVGFILVTVLHLLLFYWFEAKVEEEESAQMTESLVDRDRLSRAYRQIKLKEENFNKYFDEKPAENAD